MPPLLKPILLVTEKIWYRLPSI